MTTVKIGAPVVRLPRSERREQQPLFKSSYENDVFSVEMIGGKSQRMIEGVATSPTIDADKWSLSSAGCQIKLPLPLLCAHGEDLMNKRPLDQLQIGEVFLFRKSASQVIIRARVEDTAAGNYAWRLIENHEFAALSVNCAERVLQGVVNGVKFFSNWRVTEISICKRGKNPDCVFWIVE